MNESILNRVANNRIRDVVLKMKRNSQCPSGIFHGIVTMYYLKTSLLDFDKAENSRFVWNFVSKLK